MTEIRRRDGRPIWLDKSGRAQPLGRVDLGSTATSGYDESWLQSLLHSQPSIFPIEQIETGFGDLIPLCREFPLMFGAGRSGSLDNVFITNSGGLVLIEAKLWRNPQARREVIAQAMEYAGAIFRMDYETFERTALRARQTEQKPHASIYELVHEHDSSVGEAEFVEAVSRNLARGRAVIAVVGDGIRDDIAPLAELLQSHAGQRFTFALVELGVYEAPDGIRLVVPSVLAKTVLIERGVVRLDHDSIRIEPVRAAPAQLVASPRRAVSIGEDEFYELLAQKDPEAPELLRRFLERTDRIGVYVDRQAGLNLKHEGAGDRPLNLGVVRKDGFLDTGPASWWRRLPEAERYNQTLATAIGGKIGSMKAGSECVLRTANDKTPRLTDLLPDHEDLWLEAMERYIAALVEREGSEKS
ncbi:hypothetical protein [Rhizobium sp. Leaf453]|uniref:hypothetical protein n=1 Tax=Rhizobium sp. Leaf453 TaxID=1736380 RepID=UPI000715E957|nr:hypothetical protein [Rhizobium sp. Leaf453]KQT92638.1 hypothetical protein ASG68_17750 [Rhizobium sp. Leaf453]